MKKLIAKNYINIFRYKIITDVAKILKENNKTEALNEFKENAISALKYLYKDLDNYEIYTGESVNPNASVSCFLIIT